MAFPASGPQVEALQARAAEMFRQLPPPTQHLEGITEAEAQDRLRESQVHQEILQEKLQDKWFAALVPLHSDESSGIAARFDSWKDLVDFIQERDALVEVWAYMEGGHRKPRRLPAAEIAALKRQSNEPPSYVTITYRDEAAKLHQDRIEFGFHAAEVVMAAHQGYQRQRNLQIAMRDVLSARDEKGRLNSVSQWEALRKAVDEGRIQLVEMPEKPKSPADLFVSAEYEVDDSNSFSRIVRVYRESEIHKRIRQDAQGRAVQILVLKKAVEKQSREAWGYGVRGVSDELVPMPSPIVGQDQVELRIKSSNQPDVRKWNVVEFGAPEILKQSTLARFALINAHMDQQRKAIALRKSKYDLIAEPLIAGLNIGGGLAGVGFPLGDAGRLLYNLVSSQLIADVPTVRELRDLFALMAARDKHPDLKIKPADFLSPEDIKQLTQEGRKLSDAQVQEYLEAISDDDLKAMLRLARLARYDARITNFLNILTSAGKVSGVTESGLLRDIFNSAYFSLNGDINLKTILAVAVGQKVMTPLSGTSLEALSKGDGPAKAWLQFFEVSVDARAVLNTATRLSKRTLARKELEKPFPYAARMSDLAAYEIRIFGFPLLIFYKRGLMKEDYEAFQNDYAYGLLGVKLVEHFATKEEMDEEIRAGRMAPLGYVRIFDGKGGWKETNLAVFAHRIPRGKYQGKTAIIIYGLKAYEEHSQFVEREVERFRQYERALQEGAVIEQVVKGTHPGELPSSDLEPIIHLGQDKNEEIYTPLLSGLLEVRRYWQNKKWGLAISDEELNQVATILEQFAAQGIWLDDRDPLVGIDKFNSAFIYQRRVNGKPPQRLPMNLGGARVLSSPDLLVRPQISGLDGVSPHLSSAQGARPLGTLSPSDGERDRVRGSVHVLGKSREIKMTLISSLAEIDRTLKKSEEAQEIERLRREAVSEKGEGIVLINQAKEINGRYEVGPLVRGKNGQILGTGVRSGAAAIEEVLTLVDQLPVTDRARLRFNNFASTVVTLDGDGDGSKEKVFLTLEFPFNREIKRAWINPLSGEREILVFGKGLWRRTITAHRIVELEYDDGSREIRSRTYANQGTLEKPVHGPIVEETRTLATWLRDLNQPNIDPYLPVIAKLKVNYVTGQSARDTYGLFPLPVETADDQFISQNRFNAQGIFESAKIVENGVAEQDFQRNIEKRLLEPIPGRERFTLTSTLPNLAALSDLKAQDYKSVVERKDIIKGLSKTIVFDNARFGRQLSENYIDAFDGTNSFGVSAAREYREDFFFGLIPAKTSVKGAATGAVLTEVLTASYDPLSRRLAGIATDYTGKLSTNLWDYRWENPIVVETKLRKTVNQYNRDETALTASTTSQPAGEQISSSSGQFNPGSKTWLVNRSLWYRPGIVSRVETNILSGFGKLIASQVGGLFESRPQYNLDGAEVARRTAHWNARSSQYDVVDRQEEDYRWQKGGRDARVQTYIDGLPYDSFRTVADEEGRTLIDGIRQWPGLELKAELAYDGASERVLKTEQLQNGQPRLVQYFQPEQRQADGTYVLPVKLVPQWGLIATQTWVIGDVLGRPRQTVFENGDVSQVREWFEPTSIPRVAEAMDRHGKVKERFVKALNRGIETAMPFDITSRYRVSPWGAAGLMEEEAVVRGTDIALFKDAADERTYYDLAKAYQSPAYAVDTNGDHGFTLTLNQSAQSNVVVLFNTQIQAPQNAAGGSQIAEPVLTVEAIDLRGLFYQKAAKRTLDRSGKIIEEVISRFPNLGTNSLTADTLRKALQQASPTKIFRYQYKRGWLIETPDPQTDGPMRVFTDQQPAASANGLPVNDGGRREFVTRIDGTQAGSVNEIDSPDLLRFSQRVHSPQERQRNPYMPDRTNAWTSWTTTHLGPNAEKLFDSETVFDAQGQPRITKTMKLTSSGSPATKVSYFLPPPTPGTLKEHSLAAGPQTVRLDTAGRSDFSGSDFVYFHWANETNAPWKVVLADRSGRKVTVTREGVPSQAGSILTWPIGKANSRWLPNQVLPVHGTVLDAPRSMIKSGHVVAVSVHDLALAGLNIRQVESFSLMMTNQQPVRLEISPLYHLAHGERFVGDDVRERPFYEEQGHSSGFKVFTKAQHARTDRQAYSGQKQWSVAEFGGLPVAVTLERGLSTAFPPIVVLDQSDIDSPRPLYAISSRNGQFIEHYKMRKLGVVQIYTIVQGFDLPRFEVFDPTLLEDEITPGLISYGYDYHVTVKYAKGSGYFTRPLANLHNRVVANTFKYASDRLLNLFFEEDSKEEQLRRYHYSLLHNARLQADSIKDLQMLAQVLLPTKDVPWKQIPLAASSELPIEKKRLATNLFGLHTKKFSTNLTATYEATYLIPTSLDTKSERFVDTVQEAELIMLAVKLGEVGLARQLLDFYRQKSQSGQRLLHGSYDAQAGTAMTTNFMFERPLHATRTAEAQLAMADAAFALSLKTSEPKWFEMGKNLMTNLLVKFRQSEGKGPRGIAEHEVHRTWHAYGVTFWPEAERYLLRSNARAYLLLKQLEEIEPRFSGLMGRIDIRRAREEQEAWLKTNILPQVERTGVVPQGLFQIQDIKKEPTAVGVERWTSAEDWLTFLEAAYQMGIPEEKTHRWLEHLARLHGVFVDGQWGLDWSIPLLRPDAISPELTARFLRVAKLIGHESAEKFARQSLSSLRTGDAFTAVTTKAQPKMPLSSGLGFSVYPHTNQQSWPVSFMAYNQLIGPNQDPVKASIAEENPESPPRTDLTVFILLTAAFYLSILGTSIFWWRFRALRRREQVAAEIVTQLVPDPVMQRAEERWSKRVLGVQTPANAERSRFSNSTVEQNFLMQLRAIYKLVIEWRRQENEWAEDDPRLAEDESDDWLNGLDEFSSMAGIYMRFVIKAGMKDGFSKKDVLAENEDSNHIWSRLVMYFSEYYWALLTLMTTFNNLVTYQDKVALHGEISQLLKAMGMRTRMDGFDARKLFNFPAHPLAMDLLIIQKPGVTLSKVLLDASMKLKIPYSHLAGFIEKYKAFKKRENPYPIHPYLIEFAKVLPHFFLMGMGALVWYNQSIDDSPIVPYLWSKAADFARNAASLTWGLPLLGGLVLSVLGYFARIYRFEGSMLVRERKGMILDATVTSLFVKKHSTLPQIKPGRRWSPELYEWSSWGLRAVGFLWLGITLLRLETPNFATFLVVKGLFAMLAFAEVAGILLPLAGTALSKFLQDRVTDRPKTSKVTQFVNRLNITATKPASPVWLSIKYHNQPSVPSGGFWGMAQAIVFYFVLAGTFFFIGAFLCQQIFSLWFTDTYLNAANWKLFVGSLLFWNTMYLLRYGLFLMFTGIASCLATFPIKGIFAILGFTQITLLLMEGTLDVKFPIPPALSYSLLGIGVVLILFESQILGWFRGPAQSKSPSGPGAEEIQKNLQQIKSDGSATLGVVYMGGDDLAYQKLTPSLLMGRWSILRDKLDSQSIRLLSGLVNYRDDATLEGLFKLLYETEKKFDVTLWHSLQIVATGETPRLPPESGLNLVIDGAASREELLTAWHVRRWLVTMMSTAGHAQDTAVTLVDIAMRLEREGLAANTVYYLIQNKYDNNENNRPVQTPYDKGELGQRNKLARLLMAVAPGTRAYSVQNWTPFGFKAGGLTGMDLIHEESLKLTTMLVLDRNATVHDLDALMLDLAQALTDPDVVIIIPGRGTTNTLTPIGQGSQMVEEGHRSFLKGLMGMLGGTASESVGTGWGNILAVYYGRVQRAMIDSLTPKMPVTSRMKRGSSFAVRAEGLIGFAPHAVGISEDTWAVSQTAHNAIAFGRRVKFLLSRAMWHKIRETWSHSEWLASFPRWSGGFVQMMHDPIMQRINDFGAASVFAKEIRANSGRNFLSAPFALLNILLMPLAIMLDVTPFVQILIVLWIFGFIMNQILTVHGLNTYLESCGFYRIPAMLGAVAAAALSFYVPMLKPFAPGLIMLGLLYGGFIVGLNRWLYTRVRDVILFGPQLVLHTLGQVVRQSMEFTLSGASPEDAKGVNMSFRAWVGPREDRPLDGFPNFINLKTVIWIVGLLSVILNLFALSNLDMLNVLLLLPSLLFSVSALIGPFVLRPKIGKPIGKRIIIPKLLGWLASFAFFTIVSTLIGRGGWLIWAGVLLFAAVFGYVTKAALKYGAYRTKLRRLTRGLHRLLAAANLAASDAAKIAHKIINQTGGDAAKVQSALNEAAVAPDHHGPILKAAQEEVGPALKAPAYDLQKGRFASSRFVSEFHRSFVLSLFVFIWFFIVPVPGLFVFTAGNYRISMELYTIVLLVCSAVGAVLAGFWLGQLVQWIDRRGLKRTGLKKRIESAYHSFQSLLKVPGNLTDQEISSIFALFTDVKTYIDQRSYEYARRSVGMIEQTLVNARPVAELHRNPTLSGL